MARWPAITAFLLAIPAVAPFSQVRAQQASATTVKDEIRAFDQGWGDAEYTHDRKKLEQILDEGYVATFENGKTYDKSAFIDIVMGYKFPSPFNLVYDSIHIYGDTAITVSRFGFGDALGTKVTAVYIRRDGQWRVIAEQMTALAPPRPAPTPTTPAQN
jgi:hypothetical protein